MSEQPDARARLRATFEAALASGGPVPYLSTVDPDVLTRQRDALAAEVERQRERADNDCSEAALEVERLRAEIDGVAALARADLRELARVKSVAGKLADRLENEARRIGYVPTLAEVDALRAEIEAPPV